MKVLFALAAAAGALMATSARAGSPDGSGMLAMGVGTQTCAQVTATEQTAAPPGAFSMIAFTWAQGFMSGLNGAVALAGGTSKDLNGILPDVERQMIDNWCSQNPDKEYAAGVTNLYGKLPDNSD